MNKTLFTLCLGVSIAACGQLNKSIVRANAYYTVPSPGTVMHDDNGKEMPPLRTKVYFLFLEIKGEAPTWTKAWINNQSFGLISLTIANDMAVVVGRAIPGDKAVKLKPAKGNRIVKLELAPEEKVSIAPQKIAGNEVLLEGSVNGKRFYSRIVGLIELASPEYQ